MHVALVEHEAALAYRIRMALAAVHIRVDPCEDRAPWGEKDCDAILLGVIDPVASVGRIRHAKCRLPVLVTTKGQAADIVATLSAGADDHLPRPFDLDELVARLRALTRRGHVLATVDVQDLAINLDDCTGSIGGQPLHLTVQEWALLEFLALRQGRVVSREALLRRLYDDRHEGDFGILNIFLSHLRKKLAAPSGGNDYIVNVWGRGYMLPHARAAA